MNIFWQHFFINTYLIEHDNCNTSSPDDGPKSGRKYLGNNKLWKTYQLITAKYHKINTAIQKD